MTQQEILNKFQSLTIWKNGDRRAPHKPLLVMLALGYLQNHDQRFLVSEKVIGTDGFDLWLGRFHGDEIRQPIRAVYEPGVDYIAWNHDQVFKSPERVW